MARANRWIWERFELDYTSRHGPLRRSKRYVYGVSGLIPLLWLLYMSFADDRAPYSSGPMSAGHVTLADDCSACHVDELRFIRFRYVRDADKTLAMNAACLNCHGSTIGHDLSTKTAWHQLKQPADDAPERILACSSCHVEHRGARRLVDMDDRQCVGCHRDLEALAGIDGVRIEPRIETFNPTDGRAAHPEFRPLSEPDAARIKFNHAVHLRPEGLVDRRPDGTRKKYLLACFDCHRAGLSELDWRFGEPELHEDGGRASADSEPDLQEAYMRPIRYSLHCSGCHRHRLSRRFPLGTEEKELEVPHRRPQTIRTVLSGQLTVYINRKPIREIVREINRWMKKTNRPLPQLTPESSRAEIDLRILDWVKGHVSVCEDILYGAGRVCADCHEVEPATEDGAVPVIAQTNIPRRWMTHASFNHERHRVVDCIECHAGVRTKSDTADVMLPGIDVCRRCHAAREGVGASAVAGVSDRCVLCHSFHRPPTHGVHRPGVAIDRLRSAQGG